MKVVLQRVNYANVKVDGKIIGEINKGYLALLGISNDDTKEIADKMVNKIKNLRIFDDENDRINLSISDIGGSLLVVSQFTLYADCQKGNRPSFTLAAKPDMAENLYEYFLSKCTEVFGKVEHGSFGADMKVTLENDGPFTVIIEM
jgi:D-tyrosyl-tRNA(Tyr) deacylase